MSTPTPSKSTVVKGDGSDNPVVVLTLRVASLAGRPGASLIEYSFGPEGGTIGRGEDNALVLPDPRRYVSTQHALVFSRDGEYFLTDLSANGVFLDDAEKPLGKGFTAKLQDGDRLTMGDYRLAVELRVQDATIAQPPSVEPAAPEKPVLVPEEKRGDPLQYLSQPPAGGAERKVIDPLSLIGGATLGGGEIPPGAKGGKPATWPDHRPGAEVFFEPPQVQPEAIPPGWDASLFPHRATEPETQEPVTEEPPHPATETEATPALDTAVAAIFQAAGLDPARLPTGDPRQTLELVGQVLQTMVAGFQKMLLARARLKSEFQMDATSVQPFDNNPLKFSTNAEQGLRRLFFPGEPGFLPARHAFAEALQDMENHELGMMTGLRAMFDVLLQRFDPAALERHGADGAGLGRFLSGGKGQLWEQYKSLYERMKRDADDEFQSLFREVFVQAYERQVRELAAARAEKGRADRSGHL